jgi:hypothetical protein
VLSAEEIMNPSVAEPRETTAGVDHSALSTQHSVLTLVRRFLTLAALMFWQGGFTFYAAVVVPLASAELGHLQQGFITRHVAWYLNLAGAVALLILAWDAAAAGGGWLGRGRWLTWGGMAAALALLVWLHPRLAGHLIDDELRVVDRAAFRAGHRVYLWTCTVQWGFALAYAGLTLAAWRSADRADRR